MKLSDEKPTAGPIVSSETKEASDSERFLLTDTDLDQYRELKAVLHETGMTPSQLAARIKTLEVERAEAVNFAKMVAKSCECECAVTPHDQHQDGCMHWLQTRTNHLIAKLEGTQGE